MAPGEGKQAAEQEHNARGGETPEQLEQRLGPRRVENQQRAIVVRSPAAAASISA